MTQKNLKTYVLKLFKVTFFIPFLIYFNYKEIMKTIWIINEYAGSPYHGMEYRHYYLSKELIKRGYNVYIISASYSHLYVKLPDVKKTFEVENIDGITYIWVKVPKYKNSWDKKRVIKWLVFTFKTYFFLPVRNLSKPDYIIISSPSLFPIISGYKWARRFKARLIFEVKDIWPLSLIETGGYSKYHPFILIMGLFEKFAYCKSDKVISVLPLAFKHIENLGLNSSKFIYIPNGIAIDELEHIDPLSNEIKRLIPENKFNIIYAGTFGKNDPLEYLLQGALLLKDHKDIHFILVGKGMEENNLKELAKNLELSNISFIPPVSKSQVQEILKLCKVCYIGWKNEKLYKYGISANKIFDYMYSGKPILHSYSGKADIVKKANCGITVEAENSVAIAEAILKLYNMKEEQRNILGKNGKEYVLKHHTYEKITDKFEEIFKGNL